MYPKYPLAIRILETWISKTMKKSPKLGNYDGKEDPDEHMQLINDRLNYFSIDDAYKCKIFVLTLIGLARV